MAYEVRVYEDGEELQVAEFEVTDSADPDTLALTVYVWKPTS